MADPIEPHEAVPLFELITVLDENTLTDIPNPEPQPWVFDEHTHATGECTLCTAIVDFEIMVTHQQREVHTVMAYERDEGI